MARPDFSHASECMAGYEIPGEVRVSVGWIGEGWNGDFDEEDLFDTPLLRFDVRDLKYPEDEYQQLSRSSQDASYCTQLPAWTPIPVLESVCRYIAEDIAGMTSWKRVLEEWSWIGPEVAQTIHKLKIEEV